MILRNLVGFVCAIMVFVGLPTITKAQCSNYQLASGAPTQTPGTVRCCYPLTFSATVANVWSIQITPLLPSTTFALFTPTSPFIAPTNTNSSIVIRNAAGFILANPNQALGELCINNVPSGGVSVLVQISAQNGSILCTDTLHLTSCTTPLQGCLDVSSPTVTCLMTQGALQYVVTTSVTNQSGQNVSVQLSAAGATVSPQQFSLPASATQSLNVVVTSGQQAGSSIPIVFTAGALGAVVCSDTASVTLPSCSAVPTCGTVQKNITTSQLFSINGITHWSGTITTSSPVLGVRFAVVSAERKLSCPTVPAGTWLPMPTTLITAPMNAQTPQHTNAVVSAVVQGFPQQSTVYTPFGAMLTSTPTPLSSAPFTTLIQLPPPIPQCPDSVRLCIRVGLMYNPATVCDTIICLEFPRRFIPVPWASGNASAPGMRARPHTDKSFAESVQSEDASEGRTSVVWSDDGSSATLVFSVPEETVREGVFTGTTQLSIAPIAGGGTVTRAQSGDSVRAAINGSILSLPVRFVSVTDGSYEARVTVDLSFASNDVEMSALLSMDYASPIGRISSPSFVVSSYRPGRQGGTRLENELPGSVPENIAVYAITMTNSNAAGKPMGSMRLAPTNGSRLLGGGSLGEDEDVVMLPSLEPVGTTGENPWTMFAGKSVTTSKNNARLVDNPWKHGKTGIETPQRTSDEVVSTEILSRALPHNARTRPLYLTISRPASGPTELEFSTYDVHGIELSRGTMVLDKPVSIISSSNDIPQVGAAYIHVRNNGTQATASFAASSGNVGEARLRIINISGENVITPQATVVDATTSIVTMPIEHLAQGRYTVILEHQDTVIASAPMMITR